ncbi:hypothetical protein DS901_14165 [Loktanella sp. D2R18]|uniref:ankyrin repeat domain-containing protein n=1 Tax=Rhodobacterales TaxID=204455 RepID=UPI000DEBAB3E|nr:MULTISPECIES: ankyrin repeat domain-containing protein [Rhodobacterales]MDO6588883.1 ankyrin repeat domain-containing protein [Yoonia sp. 1_MG-2023]RBW41894.1 hypothetical protein DS901_14165 [Loktanella sp. D2R18]
MTDTLDALRQQAKTLQKRYQSGDRAAIARIDSMRPRVGALKRADFLHVIARENDFGTWPQLKAAVEAQGMDRAAKLQRLKIALYHGQTSVVEQLIGDIPDLAAGAFGLMVALYDLDGVSAMLAVDPQIATRKLGPRRSILHLAFSKMLTVWPHKEADMLAIADLLLEAGADVNDGYGAQTGDPHLLSALYGALGHAGNMPLARWLLTQGANPDDGESLYHATELGHLDGLALLLEYGAQPAGTNALLRAMDFDNLEAVQMLLAAGAQPDETLPALHHAARRGSSAEMVALLLRAGANPDAMYQGASSYAAARVFGNRALANAISERGKLSEVEQILADCADGQDVAGRWIDPAKIAPAFTYLLHEVMLAPARMDHLKALVAVGVPWDLPDDQGVTPVQSAGWQGLPETMQYFLKLGADLSFVNGFGGTLLTTIIHGSENCADRRTRDHIACLDLALSHGVALPRKAIKHAGNPAVAAYLADWAQAHPGQVVEHGIV